MKKVSNEHKNIIRTAFRNGKISTDSDIFDLAEELNISTKDAAHIIYQEMSKNTPCENCRHIDSRFFNSPAGLCNLCSRLESKKDMFEPEATVEEE